MTTINNLIERAKLYIPSGASFTGDVSDRIRKLMSLSSKDLAAIVSVQPGDFIRPGTKDNAGISLATPIGYDVWYLFHTDNVLNFEDDERTDEILERLDPFLSKLQGIKPLKTLRSIDDLSFTSWWSWPDSMNYWTNSAPYMIKMMRFETILSGRGFKYPSTKQPEGVSGYLAFPIGQLGVMEIVALIGESVTEADGFKIAGEESILEGGDMMPPVHHNRGHCVGEHLIEEGYILQDNVEYPADEFVGLEPLAPHLWLRYWIKENDTFPVPGEFVALLAKSELFHCWWFQACLPFVFSGYFFQTEYYTSGIIQEVIEPDDESDEETNIYKIWVSCYEIYLRPTDFLEYSVGDRVAIIKEPLALIDNMDWTLIQNDKIDGSSSVTEPDPDWRIIPVSFYE
ncbi:MAG: hypothetical protein ACT6FC_07260 [Methanosarcinaceae archaeon]